MLSGPLIPKPLQDTGAMLEFLELFVVAFEGMGLTNGRRVKLCPLPTLATIVAENGDFSATNCRRIRDCSRQCGQGFRLCEMQNAAILRSDKLKR